jgi:hypothetical protein
MLEEKNGGTINEVVNPDEPNNIFVNVGDEVDGP